MKYYSATQCRILIQGRRDGTLYTRNDYLIPHYLYEECVRRNIRIVPVAANDRRCNTFEVQQNSKCNKS